MNEKQAKWLKYGPALRSISSFLALFGLSAIAAVKTAELFVRELMRTGDSVTKQLSEVQAASFVQALSLLLLFVVPIVFFLVGHFMDLIWRGPFNARLWQLRIASGSTFLLVGYSLLQSGNVTDLALVAMISGSQLLVEAYQLTENALPEDVAHEGDPRAMYEMVEAEVPMSGHDKPSTEGKN